MLRPTLNVNGAVYEGWKSCVVARDLECVASQFELELSDIWPGALGQRFVLPGDEVSLCYGPHLLLTGYVDELNFEHDSKARTMRIAGRSMTADLVDCSVMNIPGQWRAPRFESIVDDLLKPFKIGYGADVDTGPPLVSFAINAGETVYEALSRAAQSLALMLTDDGMGNLIITRGGASTRPRAPALVVGENVLKVNARFDYRDRFSTYVMKGQWSAKEFGDDAESARRSTQAKAVVDDPGVRRYRPLLMVPSDSGSLKTSALKEADKRASASAEIEVEVQGWLDDEGRLWDVNSPISLVDELLGLDTMLLTRSVRFELSETGTKTRLGLVPRDSYRMVPLTVAAAVPFWNKRPEVTRR